jgi:hypothetical protein
LISKSPPRPSAQDQTTAVFDFKVILAWPDDGRAFDDVADALYDLADDATLTARGSLLIADFSRPAPTFVLAIIEAVALLRGLGLEIKHLEPDSVVTASEIAERADLTRAAVSQYVQQQRRAAGLPFPEPVARVSTSSPLWDWVEVASWLEQQGQITEAAVDDAIAIRMLNGLVGGDLTSGAAFDTAVIDTGLVIEAAATPHYWLEPLCRAHVTWAGHEGIASSVERVSKQLAGLNTGLAMAFGAAAVSAARSPTGRRGR